MNNVTGVPNCAFLLFGVMEDTNAGNPPVTVIEPLVVVGVTKLPS